MKNKKITIKNIILCFIILQPFTIVHSANSTNNYSLEFALSVSNQSTIFNFSPTTYKTRTEQLGINWYEPFSHYFHAGLELGYIDMSQLDNTVASAQFSSGQYAGLLLRFFPVENKHLSLSLNFNYRFYRTQGEVANQKTQFSWNQNLLFAELRYSLTNDMGILLASEYQLIDGEQQDSGSINQITTFKENQQQGYRIGLNFISNRTGAIGVEWSTGFNRGTRLYFSRKF